MATINNKLIHFKSKSDFDGRYAESTDGGNTYGDFLGTSIVFIQDAKQIWTHGQFYDANETTLASLGITATATELNYVDGVTSNIQDQLDSKVSSSALNGYLSLSGGTLSKDNLDLNINKFNDADVWYIGTWDASSIPQAEDGDGTLFVFTGDHINSIVNMVSNPDGYTQVTTSNIAYEAIRMTGQSINWRMTLGNNGLIITLPESKTATINNQEISVEGHTHVASDITALTGYTEGTSTTTLTSTMSLNTALASLQNQLHNKVSLVDGVLTLSGNSSTGNVINLSNEGVQDLNIVSAVGNNIVLKKSGGPSLSITEDGILMGNDYDPYMIVLDINDKIKQIRSTSADLRIQSGMNWLTIPNDSNGDDVKWNEAVILTEDNYQNYISITDTKNTTGTSNSTSKLYLAGGVSQSNTGVQTYSNSAVYTQSGQLYATRMYATSGFYETSDARLKNFKDDVKALEVVSAIPTKYFTWKKDEEDVALDPQLHIGTSAQEIQKFYPNLVSENEDGHLTVDYARLSIIALAAIKELKSELDELKTRWRE